MNKRPRSITVISWIFIAVGSIALLYHLSELRAQRWSEQGLVWVCFVRFLAVLSGVFMLRGFNWARWLLVVWLAYHVILSAFHSPFEVVMHSLLFGVVVYFLFRPQASAYFRRTPAEPPQNPKTGDTLGA
ncbi:MAG: hypothetical protein ACRD6N_19240 [Pyrinomonadaceae bacterium]